MKLTPGTIFASDYEVVRELSTGGMGAIYLVVQQSTGKQRALKLMLPQMVSDPELRRRFEQEAKIGALIESDHVVEVVGAGIDIKSGAPWLAMELLKGEELSARAVLDAPGPMTALHAIMRQLCHALGAAHRAGIVHRDLKPPNIFLADSKRAGETRTVKVLDFGIAKIAADASNQHTAAMGSPTWMAPEQSEKGTVTPAADVWSLGLIAYYLLTGKFFWLAAQDPGGTVHQVMKEVLFDPIPLASQRAAEQGAAPLPPWFDAWFSHCLVRQAALRYKDANDAFGAFEKAVGGGHISLLPPSVSPMTTPMAPLVRTTPTGPPPPAVSHTQMGAGMTQPALPPVTPPSRSPLRWLVPLFGLAAMSGVGYFAWSHRNDRPHVEPSKPLVDVPSATAELPVDDDEDIDPAPALDSGVKKTKKTTKPHPSASHSAGPSLSAALEQMASAQPTSSRFDRPGAIAALHAIDLSRCAIVDGPRGPSRVNVMYGNEGIPRRFMYNPPYQGTVAEVCINNLLRKARVDPFTGPMQVVSLQIDIQ